MKNFLLPVMATVMLAGCGSTGEPAIQTGPDAEVIDGNLHRVDNTRVELAYMDPNADFSRYQRLIVDPLGVDHVEIINPSASKATRTGRDNWELDDKDRQALRDAFADAMFNNLAKNGQYPIVEEAGDDVMRISAVLTAIAPNAPQDSWGSRSVGRTRVYSEGAGELFITIHFADSESGEVLALVKDQKEGSNMWGVNNRVSNLGEVRFMFNAWARQIRAWLDQMHSS